ncbi:MAG: energy transducer TonB [Candidatus Binatia bacterium]|nr:energy transducer TonB [Candidatus Binatia bacterium]
MIPRYAISATVALLITFGLFSVMQQLVARGSGGLSDKKERTVFDFVRLARQEKTETKKRQKPERKIQQPQSSMPMAIAKSSNPVKQAIKIPHAAFRPELSLAGGPTLGAGGADADVMPLVRVNPRYPPRAQARGMEGWVYLEFAITPQGTTTDIVVLDSDPKGYFERSAVNAVKKYKYKPRVEGGKAIMRPGVQVVISFDIQE